MQFASLNVYNSMESVVRTVLPGDADDGSWTSDMFVHWPQVLFESRTSRSGLVPLSCNGYSMYVPFEYLLAVRESLCPARSPTVEDGRPQVGDSAAPAVVEPRRREPLPRRKAEDLRERIASSSQLDGRTARRPERGARSGGEVDALESTRMAPQGRAEPRVRSPGRTSAEPRSDRGRRTGAAREPRSATPRSAGGASRAEPQSRPATAPSSRPSAREPASGSRAGDASRAGSRRADLRPMRAAVVGRRKSNEARPPPTFGGGGLFSGEESMKLEANRPRGDGVAAPASGWWSGGRRSAGKKRRAVSGLGLLGSRRTGVRRPRGAGAGPRPGAGRARGEPHRAGFSREIAPATGCSPRSTAPASPASRPPSTGPTA